MKRVVVSGIAVACCWTVLSAAGASEARPFKPKVPDVFEALDAGQVKPRGWMLDRARAAANGLVGHLDEVDVEFRRAWTKEFRPPADKLTWQTGSWSFEGGGYWFDGLVRLAAQLDDAQLLEKVASRFEPTLRDAKPTNLGLLTWLDRTDETTFKTVAAADNGFVLCKCGLMARALGAYWEVSRDKRVPAILARAFDEERILRIGNAMHLPPAAFDAWRMTGDARTAKALDDFYAHFSTMQPCATRYLCPPKPEAYTMKPRKPSGNDWMVQHGVMFNEGLVSILRGWQWTGREDFRNGLLAWMDWLDSTMMQPYGVIVADEDFGAPGTERGTETCTVAASIWLRLQLLAATGDARWADQAERAILNAAPACVNHSYTKHVYFQFPNRTTPLKPTPRGDTPITPQRYETKHFPMCCTADLTRIIPMAIQYKWLADSEGVVAALYGPDEATVRVNGTKVVLRTETDYPFDERIMIRVEPESVAEWTMKLRLPSWCRNPSISVNGEKVAASPIRGFAAVRRQWRSGDVVQLDLPMRPTLATLTDASTDTTCAVVSYGPLLMAAPLKTFDENNPVWPKPRCDWRLDPRTALAQARVVKGPMPKVFDWPVDSPLKLEVDTSRGRIALVPYGATYLRVSMFPVEDK